MFKIYGQRKVFWQWDLNQRLIVEDADCCEVHFCNKTTGNSLVCEVYEENGMRLVNVPNILLQANKPVTVYAYRKSGAEQFTKFSDVFMVRARSKPEDYIYTETEIKSLESLNERVTVLEEKDSDGAQIAMLIEADLFPAVHDADGAILTDENGNVILRY